MNKVQTKTGIFLLTVDTVSNYEIVEYFGLVTGKAIMGANFVKDFFARVRDTIGGRVSGYEGAIGGAMEGALLEMAMEAKSLGANAVIGIDIKTGTADQRLLMASCAGTAVRIVSKA